MFEALDPDYANKVRESLAKQGAIGLIGGELVSVEPGRVVLALPYNTKITQQHGFVHAGIVTTLLDTAAGYAAYSLMPADAEVLTIEFKTNLMAPAKGERFRFEGKVIKRGRTIMFCEADAFAINDNQPDRHVVSLSATMMVVTGRDDVKR